MVHCVQAAQRWGHAALTITFFLSADFGSAAATRAAFLEDRTAPADDLAGEAGGFCGPVTGYVDGENGDHVVLDLALTGFGGIHIGVDGTLSANGERIGGVLHLTTEQDDYAQPTAVIRYQRSAQSDRYPVGAAWPDATHHLVDNRLITQTARGPFRVGERYRLSSSAWTTLGGDLGVAVEMPSGDTFTLVPEP